MTLLAQNEKNSLDILQQRLQNNNTLASHPPRLLMDTLNPRYLQQTVGLHISRRGNLSVPSGRSNTHRVHTG